MFTIYIHILEVLAQNPNGASVKMIVDMSGGLIPTDRQALSYLRDLKTQKLVDHHTDPSFWVMTERARDYCERVTRCYDLSHPEEILEGVHYVIADGYVLSIDADGMLNHEYSGLASDDGSDPLDMSTPENMPQEGTQEAISGVLTEDTTFTMPLMGENTIAEVSEGIEKIAGAKVVKATLDNGIVTLTVRTEIAPGELYEFEECYECGGSCNYHEEWCPYNEA